MNNNTHFIAKELQNSFTKALASSVKAKAQLKELGIDAKKVSVGYNSGVLHLRESVAEQIINQYEQLGLLAGKNKAGRYKQIWAKGSLVFPLCDIDNQIVNWYGVSLKSSDAAQTWEYLNSQGLFPRYPSKNTEKLECGYNIISTAQLLSREDDESDIALVALKGGELTEEHYSIIGSLPHLQKLGLPLSLLSKETVEEVHQFIHNHRPDLELYDITNVNVDTSNISENDFSLAPDEPESTIENSETQEVFSIDTRVNVNAHSTENTETNSINHFDPQDEDINPNNPLRVEVVGGIDSVDPNQFQRLEVTLKIHHQQMPKRVYRNTVDVYHFQGLSELVEEASTYLGIEQENLRIQLDDLIIEIEKAVERKLNALDTLTKDAFGSSYTINALSSKEEQEVSELLESKTLVQTISEDLLDNIGIVNEKNNRMIAFLTTVSRKLKNPLHLINMGSTGTGKSHLIETVGRTLPPEELLELTSISEKALFNINGSLSHKVIMIQDLFDVSDTVMYQIRELQSKGKLTRSVTQKQKNGTFTTIFQETSGPVSIMASTTNDDIYADNSNRSILITQDESDEQDKAILARQKAIASRSINLSKERETLTLLQNIQRKLKTYPIKNPYANDLELPPFVERKRRTMGIYLGLIETITLLNQYQRKIEIIDGKEYLVTHIDDIRWANQFIEPVLTYKSDLLGNASRNFFEELKVWAEEQKINVFTSKEIAQALRKKPNTIKSHIRDLREYGLLEVVSGDRYRNGFNYSISEKGEYGTIQKQVQETLNLSLKLIETKYVA